MIRRITILLVVALIGYIEAKSINTCNEKRPNIIFILADDLIYDGLGCMGRADMKTPNIDKLGNGGLIFSNAYNATAICMASRASIMTGMYEFSTGCNFDHGDMDHEIWQQSYPYLLRENGYITGFAGKFGFKVKQADGKKGNVETVKEAFDWWSGWLGQGKYQMEGNKEAEEYIKVFGDKPEHTTYALGQMGARFIQKYAEADKPFCLSVSFKAPHTPYATDPRYDDVFIEHTFQKPGNYGSKENLPKQATSGRPYDKGKTWMKDYQGTMNKYHTMVYGMDQAVGMIMDELSKQHIAENTVIIFTSDNGHFNGSKALGGKLYAYEEGSKAPLIYYDPGLSKENSGTKIDALTATMDIAPTILELAGVEIPSKMQGNSLLPLAEKRKSDNHESLLLMNLWGIASAQSVGVVTKEWKYINWFYGIDGFSRTEELFNMKEDPLEENNLIKEGHTLNILNQMYKYYDEWMEVWKAEGYSGNGYPKYVKLADRNIPFTSHSMEMIKDMYPAKNAKKEKNKNTED